MDDSSLDAVEDDSVNGHINQVVSNVLKNHQQSSKIDEIDSPALKRRKRIPEVDPLKVNSCVVPVFTENVDLFSYNQISNRCPLQRGAKPALATNDEISTVKSIGSALPLARSVGSALPPAGLSVQRILLRDLLFHQRKYRCHILQFIQSRESGLADCEVPKSVYTLFKCISCTKR